MVSRVSCVLPRTNLKIANERPTKAAPKSQFAWQANAAITGPPRLARGAGWWGVLRGGSSYIGSSTQKHAFRQPRITPSMAALSKRNGAAAVVLGLGTAGLVQLAHLRMLDQTRNSGNRVTGQGHITARPISIITSA